MLPGTGSENGVDTWHLIRYSACKQALHFKLESRRLTRENMIWIRAASHGDLGAGLFIALITSWGKMPRYPMHPGATIRDASVAAMPKAVFELEPPPQ